MHGVTNDSDRHIIKSGDILGGPLDFHSFSKCDSRDAELRGNRLPECSVGIDNDRLFSIEGAPASYCVVLNVEIFESLLDYLFENILPFFEIEELRLASPLDTFEENSTAVRLKPTCGKRTIVLRAFSCIFQAVSDGEQSNAGVQERLYEAKLNQVTEADFQVLLNVGMLSGPKRLDTALLAGSSVNVTSKPTVHIKRRGSEQASCFWRGVGAHASRVRYRSMLSR